MTKEIEIPEGYEARIEDNKVIIEPKESENEKIRKELIETIRWIKEGRFPTAVQIQKSSSWIAWLEKQHEKMSDPRYSILDKLIEADDIYQMSVNDTMVEEAKNKAIEALSKLEISKLLGLEKQDEQKPTDKVEPKFKVGDEIKLAKEPKYPARKIIAIKNDAYYFDEFVYLSFIYQDEWELVKQKPIDKIEPKFKVGDWIVKQYLSYPFVIVDIKNDSYILNDIEGNKYEETIDFAHKVYHLWTIEDANDGDVLAFDDENIVIFKDLYNSTTFHSYCHIEDGIFDISPGWWEGEGFYPATKEQHDRLEKAMADAGYTFDFEKKELKKIENEPILNSALKEAFDKSRKDFLIEDKKEAVEYSESILPTSVQDGESEEEYKLHKIIEAAYITGKKSMQNPAWSEEDEMMLNGVISIVEDWYNNMSEEEKEYYGDCGYINWLKSLKDRVQPKQEWSEEDSEKLTRIHQFIWDNRKGDTDEIYQQEQDADWLMKLKPNHCKPTSL